MPWSTPPEFSFFWGGGEGRVLYAQQNDFHVFFGPSGSCNAEIKFYCQPEGQKPGSCS